MNMMVTYMISCRKKLHVTGPRQNVSLCSDSLYSRLVQYSRHRDAVEALHGGHGGLHGFLLPQVWRADVVRQQVAVVLQPRLRGKGDKEQVGYDQYTLNPFQLLKHFFYFLNWV